MSEVQEVIREARVLLGDTRAPFRFTDDEMLDEINRIRKKVNHDVRFRRRDAIIHIKDGESVYQFPRDCISVTEIRMNEMLGGRLMVSASYEGALLSGGYTHACGARYWGVSVGPKISEQGFVYRNTLSYNEFAVEPPLFADEGLSPIGATATSNIRWQP
jgi:uncharacterized protein YerC